MADTPVRIERDGDVAVVVLDSPPLNLFDQATFAGFFQAAGAINSVTVTSTTTQGGSILMTYKVDSEHIVVSDGVDTFLIEKGRIVLETAYLGGLKTR